MIVYMIGSLKNHLIPEVANQLRAAGYDAFDDWWSSSEDCDDWWQAHEKLRGRPYREAINGYHAWNVFKFDKFHLDRCHAGVLIMPAGRSGHAEFGYLAGQGKPVFVLWLEEPAKFDVMHLFATQLCFCVEELVAALKGTRQMLTQVREYRKAPWNADL